MTATVAKIPDDTITHRVLRDAIPSDFAINNDSYYHELYKKPLNLAPHQDNL